MTKIMLNYGPNGRRRLGRLLKRLLDEDTAGLSRHNSCRMTTTTMMINDTYYNIRDKTYPPGTRLFESHFFCFLKVFFWTLKYRDVSVSHFRISSCPIGRNNKHKLVFITN